MKTKNKIIIGLCIILAIFVIAMIFVIVSKVSSNDNIDSNSSTTESTNNSSITSNSNQNDSSSSDTNTSDDIIVVDPSRPTIEDTICSIDFVGFANLTALQSNSLNLVHFAQMISDATLGKDVDYAEILDTSTDDRVRVNVHFTNDIVTEYSVLFDTLNLNDYTRCVTTEEYDFIMNGGNLL